ncbi:MAG TPA: DUF2061 domain-containing protein [Caulobacteraceae bacterium]|jgi:uncharacterized membrane protein
MERPGPKPRAKHARSLVKAVTWRAIGTLDTFLWGYFITHKPLHAASIASLEVITKIFLYYVHERVWNWLPLDHRSRRRAIIKAFTWRFTGSLDTFILSSLVLSQAVAKVMESALKIAGGEAATKIVLYYIHERVWNRIAWGRKQAEEEAEARRQAREDAAAARQEAKAAK